MQRRRLHLGFLGLLTLVWLAGCSPGPGAVSPAITAVPAAERQVTLDLGDGIAMELVLIPAGSFRMGDDRGQPQEKPIHRVTITRPFYLGKHEVTQEQWKAVMGRAPSQFRGPKNPVEHVTWHDCQGFLEKLNARCADSGLIFALPTEAQWEYACRAGTTDRWSFGDDPEQAGRHACYQSNCGGSTHAVGGKEPNAWGLHDMHGNVWEWCSDWYGEDYYRNSPKADPTGPASGAGRVIRGGCWCNDAMTCRSAIRARHRQD
jgi:formylglycine-generating enzyme required for sulfatase activity